MKSFHVVIRIATGVFQFRLRGVVAAVLVVLGIVGAMLFYRSVKHGDLYGPDLLGLAALGVFFGVIFTWEDTVKAIEATPDETLHT